MATTQPDAATGAQPQNVSGTDRGYRIPADDQEAADRLREAASTRRYEVRDLPLDGYEQVVTTDGRGHIPGLEDYECSPRWGFPFTDAAEKYQPLEIRNARHGGTIIRSHAYPVDDEEVESVQLHFKISQTPSELKESPGHMEPQLSTHIRTAVKRATADDGE